MFTTEDKNIGFPQFYVHREDQSILSLLVKKHELTVYSGPTQHGRLPEKYIRPGCEMIYYGAERGQDDYRIFVIHHCTRDGNKKSFIINFCVQFFYDRLGLN